MGSPSPSAPGMTPRSNQGPPKPKTAEEFQFMKGDSENYVDREHPSQADLANQEDYELQLALALSLSDKPASMQSAQSENYPNLDDLQSIEPSNSEIETPLQPSAKRTVKFASKIDDSDGSPPIRELSNSQS